MDRYRSYGQNDDQPKQVGDGAFIGVDEYNAPENIRPGNVQQAVNHNFSSQDGNTRGGFVCLPELGNINSITSTGGAFGQKWTAMTMPSSYYTSVVYGPNKFVAIGYSPETIVYSTDGITWTAANISAFSIGNLNSIGFASGWFIVVGLDAAGTACVVLRSQDGITWTAAATPPVDPAGAPNQFYTLAYGNGKWVSTVSGFANSRSSVSSDDGNTWTTYSAVPAALLNAQVLCFGNGNFVAPVQNAILTSSDGQTWTTTNFHAYPPNIDWDFVAFGNERFVLVSRGGYVAWSEDLLIWTFTETANTELVNAQRVYFLNGVFILVRQTPGISSGPRIWTSINGTQFIPAGATAVSTSFPSSQINAIAANSDGRFITVGTPVAQASYYSDSVVASVFGSGLFSDPFEPDTPWIVLVANDKVGFFAFGKASKTVSLGAYRVTAKSTIVQANNYLYLFRGDTETPLRWNGQWDSEFELVPDTSLPTTYGSIPKSDQATYYQNRLWVRSGKDNVAASDVLAFTDYDPVANEFSINTGNSDFVVATFPFGTNTLVVFKNKSILALNNVEGSLLDVTTTEVTRQVGLIGINAVTSIGPDLAYVSYGNINLLTLTSTNNALQHKTLPLSARIRKIMDRVNWEVGYKISLGYWSNRLYVALPLDNSLFCNAVVVYNFITEQWFGEWAFNDDMNMCIQGWQVVGYLGLQRLHAITEDGRIFVTDEGQNDISGTTLCEISTRLVTRAYDTDGLNHIQRRMFLDVATNRPKFSVSTFTEGANEESVLITDQTYSRADSWKFADSAYDLTNANDDYNRAYRKDYSTGPNSVQPGTGFEPEMTQELRLPLISRRQGRLSWIEVTNTQGFISVMSAGYEARPGQRANYVQV